MYLRPDDLMKYGGCYEAHSFMTRYFPNGGELVDIMRHKYITPAFLHFGFDHLTVTDEERALYYDLLDICCEKPHTIYHCQYVHNSENCIDSQNINDSVNVLDSKDVSSSSLIINGETVDGSESVVESEFVFDSSIIYDSQNVTNSRNVVGGQFIVDSNSIYQSQNITDSHIIRDSTNLTSCAVCGDCSDLSNSLFCWKATGDHLLFNKPIAPAQFAVIRKQFNTIVGNHETLLAYGWEGLSVFEPGVRKNLNYIKQYAKLPEKLWSWAKTLPGYDALVLYNITFQSNLLK